MPHAAWPRLLIVFPGLPLLRHSRTPARLFVYAGRRTMTSSTPPAAAAAAARSYNDAIDALNSLQTPFAIIEARRKAGIRPDATSIAEMQVYLRRIGYTTDDLEPLNIIHVAGTKGKGSTCAFTASILQQHQKLSSSSSASQADHRHSQQTLPNKIGLFTSPHLVAVRERIRINGSPISEALFARYFFDVWDRLGAVESDSGPHVLDERLGIPMPPRPIYSRYLTLMSYHVFLREGVDVAVYETGIGGEFDATNIVQRPVASGISTLGIDHVFALGATVDKIAWHKAGIMKTGSPAFTIEQVPEAQQVLVSRAKDKDVSLQILPVDPRLEAQHIKIRPDATFQKKNATLAIHLAAAALRKLDPGFQLGATDPLPPQFKDGLEQVVWRGRCETKIEGPVKWHVDGAHTVDSLKMASRWFVDECSSSSSSSSSSSITTSNPPPSSKSQQQPITQALIFNQQGREEAINFLAGMHSTLGSHNQKFTHVIFCSNMTYSATGYKRDFVNHQYDPDAIAKLTAQHGFAAEWRKLDPEADVEVVPTIEDALNRVRSIAASIADKDGEVAKKETDGEGQEEGKEGQVKVHALITGSLHLVGGALGLLESVDAL